ncbi:MurR/RpiR family transcriptional regulator [Corynebacterium sp. H130]|uniref:MurR/RpiR family transcriptional regulator n=1 Tax=Corynebacterium sp. H130 TaxID=3133444 RepID=UPI0030A67F92
MNAAPSIRIRSQLPNLQPTEQRVAAVILEDMSWSVEATAGQLAERAGVGRTSVVRTAQALGYEGYQQLRVAMTQELATLVEAPVTSSASLVVQMQARIDRYAQHLAQLTSLLSEDALEKTIQALVTANRVLVVGNGLSSSLAQDFAGRLSGQGRPAEFVADALAEQITARQLDSSSVCVVLSGSGANRLSLESARAAAEAGATVVGVTSFLGSALDELATITLPIPTEDGSFRDELEHTSRVSYQLILELLTEWVASHLQSKNSSAREAVYSIVGKSLEG